jgi:dTDP-4-dehydrorhamnose 3,5-epimerase
LKFLPTVIEGAWIIEPELKTDERGFFARVWDEQEFAAHSLSMAFVQCNSSACRRRGTLRGMHWQAGPFLESKLIRCTQGRIFDVVADTRPFSASFGKYTGAELSADNHRWLYVPAGCAHGYLALKDDSEVLYAVTAAYTPSAERGIRWDDPFFAIRWPNIPEIIISDKDRSWPNFKKTL